MNSLLVLFILCIAALGYQFRLLTVSGSIAASLVGILTMLGLQMEGLLLLGAFFATSSLWSRYKRVQKNKVEEKHEKGSQRDWLQVVANGGGAAVVSLLYYFDGAPVWILCFCIFLASSNSDTWASEIGTLSKKPPISIRSLKRVQGGTSGAVSMLGTMAGISGSLLIALLASVFLGMEGVLVLFIFLFGFLGNVIDTLLGAFLQATYRCKSCGVETEKLAHCGKKTIKIRGFRILNNDIVNFLSSIFAVLLGLAAYKWFI